MKIGNLPEKEFRKMIVKIFQDLRKRMEAKIEKMQEMFTKDSELKNKQTEMNNILEGNKKKKAVGLGFKVLMGSQYKNNHKAF